MAINVFYDKEFRDKVRNLDQESLAQIMGDVATKLAVKVHTNTKHSIYFVIPNQSDDNQLGDIQAAGALNLNSIGTTSCSSSWGTASSTVSSFGTAGTVGSIEV